MTTRSIGLMVLSMGGMALYAKMRGVSVRSGFVSGGLTTAAQLGAIHFCEKHVTDGAKNHLVVVPMLLAATFFVNMDVIPRVFKKDVTLKSGFGNGVIGYSALFIGIVSSQLRGSSRS